MKKILSSELRIPSSRAARVLTSAARLPLAATCLMAALAALPAQAQIRPNSHEIHVYAGALFGDDLTDGSFSGRTPKLDDAFTFGARYGYNFSSTWGLEFSLGQTLTSATDLPSDDIDFDLTTLELAAIRHFNLPSSPRCVPYVTFGGGYAFANMDSLMRVDVNGGSLVIDTDNGYTCMAGTGVKYFVTREMMVRFDVRYRYFDKLTDRMENSLNSFEATVGIGWQF